MSRILWISSGALVWALHFAALYATTALACARGLAGSVPWVAGAATLAALGALLFLAGASLRRRGEFAGWLAIAVAGAALVGVVFDTIPLFLVPICA